jgi:hypothetical protein
MRPTAKDESRRPAQSRRRPALAAVLLGTAALAAGALGSGACIKLGYPLAATGQVDIRMVDVAGPLFAADAPGTDEKFRQSPFETHVSLFMTESGEPAFSGIVEVRIEPSEALTLYSARDSEGEPAGNKTCARVEGSFRCRASEEGYANFLVRSEGDWSGQATIVVTWADQREERDVTVLPAGLPEDVTNFTLIAGDSDRVLATFLPLKCTIGPVPEDLGSKWREGEIRVREAFVRATPPPTSPGVVKNAPVIIEPVNSSEAALSLSPKCEERLPRLRVLLDVEGKSEPFYLCFSDIGGTVEFAVTSGQKTIEPNREIVVDPEPRLLRVRTLQSTVYSNDPVDLFEISAYSADRVRIKMPVDLVTSNDLVLPLEQASISLNDEDNVATILQVVPGQPGQAELHVTPRLLTNPDCASQTITVLASPP